MPRGGGSFFDATRSDFDAALTVWSQETPEWLLRCLSAVRGDLPALKVLRQPDLQFLKIGATVFATTVTLILQISNSGLKNRLQSVK